MIKVAVHGALGRMGRQVVAAVCREPDMEMAGAIDLKVSGDSLPLPDGSGDISASADLAAMLSACRPDVMVDFSIAGAAMPAAHAAIKSGVNLVVGTTGLSTNDISEIGSLAQAKGVGAVIVPNFALGAVLMTHLAKIAARHFDYAEIIELHHDKKADAPSGTSLATARAMAKARGKPFQRPTGAESADSRGKDVEGVSVHSVRLPGLMAHQEVLLGTAEQTLSIRHDTINRECYMPGVILAIKAVVGLKGLTYGLDALLGLKEG